MSNCLKIRDLEVEAIDHDNEICFEISDGDYGVNYREWLTINEVKELINFLNAQIVTYEKRQDNRGE